ncbi:hypothetical protein KPL74_14690 [Bacillus sp. NP157]|nr:hypothetical protein KPL74_14690 [Bacillus sp. NP157]
MPVVIEADESVFLQAGHTSQAFRLLRVQDIDRIHPADLVTMEGAVVSKLARSLEEESTEFFRGHLFVVRPVDAPRSP